MSYLNVKDLYKIYGPNPASVLEAARSGEGRDSIQERTGHVVAVDGVSFDVEKSELFVIMGLSGSGKSTIVRMINRLVEPTAGTISLEGDDITAYDKEQLRTLRQRRISMVFQHFALFPHRTVGENVAYGLKVQGVETAERKRRTVEALEIVGLQGWEDSYPHELSGGMQQRVGLARGLATRAEILLMDEPFSALDPLIRREMQDLLAQLQQELKRTIVFITHDLNEAMRLGDRIAVLKDGRVAQIGTGPEILHEPADEYVMDFVADVDRSRVLTAEQAMRRPRKTFGVDADPRQVLDWLDENEANGVYILDSEDRIVGVARDDRLARGIKDGVADIRKLVTDDYAGAQPSTPLAELAGLAAMHTVPVAVIDEFGHLRGVVPRAHLLAALSGEEGEIRG